MVGANLVTVSTTTAPSPRCPIPGPQKSNFSPTDLDVYIFVYFQNAVPGDQLNIQYIRPDGMVNYVESFPTLTDGGDWCFDGHMFLAGTEAADYPGVWTAKGDLSGNPLFTVGFTVSGPAGGGGRRPVISDNGVENAASFKAATVDAGALARGSYFSIFGSDLGPAEPQSQMSYPLPTTLGDVTVSIRSGGDSVSAYVVYVSATQINGILPSNAPTGAVEMIVSHSGMTSPPAAIKVTDSNFGIFSTAAPNGPGIIQNYVSATELPLNTPSTPARPGQVEVLLGTGLGPISDPDNQPPPVGDLPVEVELTVGGKVAQILYQGRAPGIAGVDQINFMLPPDVPLGCQVPVQIRVGANVSNTVTMAIQAGGAPCEGL